MGGAFSSMWQGNICTSAYTLALFSCFSFLTFNSLSLTQCPFPIQVPFLDPCNTLLYPILPLSPIDYEEFGYPVDLEEFLAIRKYSPYDNIQKDVAYPAVLVTSSLNTRYILSDILFELALIPTEKILNYILKRVIFHTT